MLYSSIDNSKIKDLKKLHNKKYRDKKRLFLVEGRHLVLEAYKTGYLKELLLEENEILQITKIMLKQVEKRLEEKKYLVKIDPSVAENISKTKIDKNYGARPLRRAIQELVEDKIAEDILNGEIVKNKEFIFKLTTL